MRAGVDGPHWNAMYWRNAQVKLLFAQGNTHKQIGKKMRINEKTISAICAVLGLRRVR